MCIPRGLVFWFGAHQLTEHDLMKAFEAMRTTFRHGLPVSWSRTEFSKFKTRMSGGMRYFPTSMELRRLYHEGERWTLDQWLQATKGRKAWDPRDLVYGGMALIQKSTLRIDPSLQLNETEELGIVQNSHQAVGLEAIKLWPEIRVDYTASVPMVLTNLAACLLSQPGNRAMRLLSIASRARDEYEMDMYWDPLTETQHGPLPSWVPNPGNDASLAAESFFSQGGSYFKACVERPNCARISADGSILYLQAAKLGTIKGPNWNGATKLWSINDRRSDRTHHFYNPSIISRIGTSVGLAGFSSPSAAIGSTLPQGFLQFFLDLPAVNDSHGKTFESVSRVLTGGIARISHEGEALTVAANEEHPELPLMAPRALRTGLCGLLTSYIQKLEKDKDSMAKQAKSKDEVEKFVRDEKEAFEKLKVKYPNENWQREGVERTPAEQRDEQDFAKAQALAMWGRSVQMAAGDEGDYLLLAPAWVAEGDVVMLVKGSYVPYVFAQCELSVTRCVENLEAAREVLSRDEKLWENIGFKRVEAIVERAKESLATKTGCWMLAGEAYVEGVMHGELTHMSDDRFETIQVV
ncbi:hypothetical protein F5Y18DRAFT_191183 [Xylariaceae sp. FL1019]|nr:hypothetical protein F5Y18DRAFT_191183 [Xylariaceae sp. FL1019]